MSIKRSNEDIKLVLRDFKNCGKKEKYTEVLTVTVDDK